MRKGFLIGILSISASALLGQQPDRTPQTYASENVALKKRFLRLYTLPDFSKPKSKHFLDQAPTPDKIYIDFVGSGDIQKAVSSGQKLNANTGAGIIFERHTHHDDLKHWFQSLELEMSINIATTSDTLDAKITNAGGLHVVSNQRDFGSY